MKFATVCALFLAGGISGIWLWSRACLFPYIPWNDLRLAPTIALAQGWPVYSTGEHGVVSTWFYGPLPILFYWPASWAPSAAGALMVAAGLNIALTAVPLALVCFAWPGGERASDSRFVRAIAFILCLALWAERHYAVVFADNLVIACGLSANLVLVRARTFRGLWFAAGLATAALACKQITVGVPLAQVLWLGFTSGWREAARHAARCAGVGAILAALGIVIFGRAELWFTLVTLPANLGWDWDLWGKFRRLAPELTWQLLVPAVIMLLGWPVFRRRADLLLPALAWACALPFGILAVFKVGGWLNSLHSLPLWLPPVLTALLTARPRERHLWSVPLAAALLAAALACGRLVLAPQLPLRPETVSYQEAAWLARKWPNQIWFPFHPLVTLYSDHRYYSDEDGIFIRQLAHKSIAPELAAAHLPAALHLVAFHRDWNDRGIARSMMPPNARLFTLDHWTVLSASENIAPR